MHYIKHPITVLALVTFISCSTDDPYVNLDLTTSTDQSLLELQELTHEFTSQSLLLTETRNATEETSILVDQYADRFYDLIIHLKKTGAPDENISAYFNEGVSSATRELTVIRYKSTPCWDTYQNTQTIAMAAATTCMIVAAPTTGPVGVGVCLIGFSGTMVAAQVNYDRCIERTYK